MAEKYDPQLFVGREAVIAMILKWADDPNPQGRVWSIVGPPGIGKTWLLEKVRRELQSQSRRPVFSIDLSKPSTFLRTQPQQSESDLQEPKNWSAWVQQASREAHALCAQITDQSAVSAPAENMLDKLVEELCGPDCANLLPPVLVVDGFDEVKDESRRRNLEKRLLGRFMRRGCTHLLIARRVDTALREPELIFKELVKKLGALEADEASADPIGLQQLRLRSPDLAPPLYKSIPHYEWRYPKLNICLLQQAREMWKPGQPVVFKRDNLVQALQCLVHPEKLSSSEIDLLDILAHLEEAGAFLDFWTDFDLRAALKHFPGNPAGQSKPSDLLQRLAELALIVDAPEKAAGAQELPAGVRHLLRARRELRL